jgi:hypothetical protein
MGTDITSHFISVVSACSSGPRSTSYEQGHCLSVAFLLKTDGSLHDWPNFWNTFYALI